MVSILNFIKVLLDLFSDFGKIMVDVMFTEVFGYPLVFLMFGSGLLVWLFAKITFELLT